MQIHNLPNKEFKLAFYRELNELQENTEKYLNEIRKTIHEQN